jgi:hypothetical protein
MADDHTWADLVRRVAADFGATPTDEECDLILWEHTAWPVSQRPDYIETQVYQFYANTQPTYEEQATDG